MITGSKMTREREASAPVHLDTTMITRIKTRRERPASAPVHLATAMITRSKTRREREASAPVHFDTEDLGHGISWSNIRTPNGKAPKSNFGGQKYERQDQQLLPGIPDEITLDLVTPKLPWITFYTLQSVSSSWRRVIQRRQIYNARCRALATEALIRISPFSELANYGKYSDPPSIGLYSMREEKIYRLPGIGGSTGIPHRCQSISLDGRVYVMGGYSDSLNCKACGDMYVLDLVTSKGWKRCASMKNRREDFGCCIVDGKIFVCGGRAGVGREKNSALDTSLLEPEIYDPELDLWSSLKSMRYFRYSNQVAVLGDEILVHGGYCYRPTRRCRNDVLFHASPEIYNPVLDEWRTVEDPMLNSEEYLFVPLTQGKIHSIKRLRRAGWQVQVYDLDKKSWSKSSSFSFDHDDSLDMCGDIQCRNFGMEVVIPLVVDDEIVRIVAQNVGDCNSIHRLIHRSRFSVQGKITACQTARTPFRIGGHLCSRMSVIRL